MLLSRCRTTLSLATTMSMCEDCGHERHAGRCFKFVAMRNDDGKAWPHPAPVLCPCTRRETREDEHQVT
jgi:hypothetical protein